MRKLPQRSRLLPGREGGSRRSAGEGASPRGRGRARHCEASPRRAGRGWEPTPARTHPTALPRPTPDAPPAGRSPRQQPRPRLAPGQSGGPAPPPAPARGRRDRPPRVPSTGFEGAVRASPGPFVHASEITRQRDSSRLFPIVKSSL